MSVMLFELKEEHVKLLKHLRWSVDDNKVIVNKANEGDEIAPPFGFDTIYEAIDLILNGKSADIDPFTHEDLIEYSEEQKAAWEQMVEAWGDELCRLQSGSILEAIRAGIDEMVRHSAELLENPALKQSYDNFILLSKLTRGV